MKNLDFKKIIFYITSMAKIISFISLTLSVVIKVKMLLGSSSSKEEGDEDKKKSEGEETSETSETSETMPGESDEN